MTLRVLRGGRNGHETEARPPRNFSRSRGVRTHRKAVRSGDGPSGAGVAQRRRPPAQLPPGRWRCAAPVELSDPLADLLDPGCGWSEPIDPTLPARGCCPSCLGPVEIVPYDPEPWRPADRHRLLDLGDDLVELAQDSGLVGRLDAMRWVAGLCTRGGRDRAANVAYCGALHVAQRGEQWGHEHVSCRDRACPSCAKRRQSELTRQARAFVGARLEAGAPVVFATLTVPKLAREFEDCQGACDRVLDAWRETFNTQRASGRFLRLFFAGALRTLETVLSQAGRVRKDGSRVRETGWHAHIHALLERTAPEAERIEEAVAFCMRELKALSRRRKTAVVAQRWGVVAAIDAKVAELDKLVLTIDRARREPAQWECAAELALLWRWCEVTPECSRGAQDVQRAQLERVGQVTKYVTKPFEIRDPLLAREMFAALESRHCIRAMGTWRSWRKEAEELDEHPEADEAKARLSKTPLAKVFDARDLGQSVVVDFGTHEVSVSAQTILDAIRGSGGTFSAQQRKVRLAEGDMPQKAIVEYVRESMRTLTVLMVRGVPLSDLQRRGLRRARRERIEDDPRAAAGPAP